MAFPERIHISVRDDSTGSILLPLRWHRNWPVGLLVGGMFVAFAGVAVYQISGMRGQRLDTVFQLMTLLFLGFWVLGWSVGVLGLFLLTALFLFYGETTRIAGGRLIHVPRLGPFKVLIEYDLAKVSNLRVEAGGPNRARIRFDYGEGDHAMGNELPRAEADRAVQILQSAIAALGPADLGVARRVHVREPPGLDVTKWLARHFAGAQAGTPVAPAERPPVQPGGVERPSWVSPSALALIGANLVPLGGVLLFGWDLSEVMVLFWAESAVIGFYNLLKLAVIGRWRVLFLGPFFVGHYGAFMAGHFLFIYYMFVRTVDTTAPEAPVFGALADLFGPLGPALLALVVSHGVSFYMNFLGRKEYVGRQVGAQMSEPYKRIVILHLTIIIGGWLILLLKSPLPALVFLVVLKTTLDLRAHREEHRVKPGESLRG